MPIYTITVTNTEKIKIKLINSNFHTICECLSSTNCQPIDMNLIMVSPIMYSTKVLPDWLPSENIYDINVSAISNIQVMKFGLCIFASAVNKL